ncbi:hypothetical protein [Facklamia miroungae]|uniref:Uncharacterized protein n=1 Tax=Facklamia miroungae TaxID=120956 RepID=A0A1G7PFP7_9LACT|nr:hypothetical protein [Facklamia miroungae]NKZ28699.1 hypothetical protein [Facklamia miroungae]SDF85172.1 hypothetical protein SAMN05421791_101241 [Facklamia miroungae]
MNLIDYGSYAGAIIAVITLISKMIRLITAIHDLVERIDWMQAKLEDNHQAIQSLRQRVEWHERYLWPLETCQER